MDHKTQTQRNHKKLHALTVALLIIAAASGTAYLFSKSSNKVSTAAVKADAPASKSKSPFSFTGAPGWRKGPSNSTSLALFHDNGCFVSAEYKAGTVDKDAELEKTHSSLTEMGYTDTLTASPTVSIQIGEEERRYQLNQFTVTGEGSAGEIQRGQEFGYIQLTDGHVKVSGYCNTSNQLPHTVPALKAMNFTTPE